MAFAVSDGVALLLLFVVLPLVLAYAIARLVQSRSDPFPPERRTSVLLRDGEAAEGRLLDWRSPAQSFLDRHPMVTFHVAVEGATPFDIDITQSVPRDVLRRLERGSLVELRLSPDRVSGAIVFG
jgi:hypothetical protein